VVKLNSDDSNGCPEVPFTQMGERRQERLEEVWVIYEIVANGSQIFSKPFIYIISLGNFR
jgi:hypothetical protein